MKPLDPVEVLCQLVAIPSVNPMGRSESGPPFLETRLTEHLERLFQTLGLSTQRHSIAAGRDNLLARLNGSTAVEDGGPLLVFDAHQDTVPTEGMTIAPWTPTVLDGRLYGRGACDVKGGMAAMIAAIARLAAERPAAMPTIVMACTVDEEYRLGGAAALAESMLAATGSPAPQRELPSPPLPRIADAAIVAEPTGLNVIVAHKGIIRWRCHCHGRAAHSSKPEQGRNAIYQMARLVAAIEHYAKESLARKPIHPLCGPYTLNVGTIHGGSSTNIVPERCSIEIEIRVPPGGDPGAAWRELIESPAVQSAVDLPIEHEPPYMEGPALSNNQNAQLAQRLGAVIGDVAGVGMPLGVPYATNAAFYSRMGTPTVVFGPGAIEQAHTADEWISIDQLRQASEILYRFARSFA